MFEQSHRFQAFPIKGSSETLSTFPPTHSFTLHTNTPSSLSLHKHTLMDTLKALMAVHSTERRVFRRMMEMNMDSDSSRKTMAYWMYLESEGFKDLLKKIASHDDKFLALVCLEAETVLSSFHPNLDTPLSSICGPLTLNLVKPTLSLLDSLCSTGGKERVSDLHDGVCSMVFEDILERRGLLRRDVEEGKGVAVAVADIVEELVKSTGGGESESAKGTVADDDRGGGSDGGGDVGKVKRLDKLPYSGSELNPNAKEWYPSPEQVPEEERCLYMTFSNGFPLSHNQIYRLFTKYHLISFI